MIGFATGLLTVMILLGIVAAIYMIGKPRQPITRGTAIATAVISLIQLAAVLYLGYMAAGQ